MGRVFVERTGGAELPYVVGSYTGEPYKDTLLVNVGFVPSAVILFGGNGDLSYTEVNLKWRTGGMAVRNIPCKNIDGNNVIAIEGTGFRVQCAGGTEQVISQRGLHFYIAFR